MITDGRYCSFCGADYCDLSANHDDDCPINTGLFPIDRSDVREGVACSDCGAAFAEGSHFVFRHIYDNIVEAVCLGCAAHTMLVAR